MLMDPFESRETRSDADAETDDGRRAPETGSEAVDSEVVAGEAPPPPSGAGEGAALAAILADEREKYLRLAAEFDNYRKRSSRDRQEAGWRAQSDLVAGLIEALDDLARFAHLDPAGVDSETVVQGAAMVEKKTLKTLSGHGLEVVVPVDQPFDPAFHEAVGTEPALSREDDHMVARVYQPGYVFRGQLLRPARVVVKQWLG
jgi:molecular chaperone GrpE